MNRSIQSRLFVILIVSNSLVLCSHLPQQGGAQKPGSDQRIPNFLALRLSQRQSAMLDSILGEAHQGLQIKLADFETHLNETIFVRERDEWHKFVETFLSGLNLEQQEQKDKLDILATKLLEKIAEKKFQPSQEDELSLLIIRQCKKNKELLSVDSMKLLCSSICRSLNTVDITAVVSETNLSSSPADNAKETGTSTPPPPPPAPAGKGGTIAPKAVDGKAPSSWNKALGFIGLGKKDENTVEAKADKPIDQALAELVAAKHVAAPAQKTDENPLISSIDWDESARQLAAKDAVDFERLRQAEVERKARLDEQKNHEKIEEEKKQQELLRKKEEDQHETERLRVLEEQRLAALKKQEETNLRATLDLLAKEEAEQRAKMEAERRSREEVERKRKAAQEEVARLVKERKEREDAEVARRAQEEADRKRKAAQEEATRLAKERQEREYDEAKRKTAQEELARKAQLEADQHAKDEGERKAAADKQLEDAERKRKFEEARKTVGKQLGKENQRGAPSPKQSPSKTGTVRTHNDNPLKALQSRQVNSTPTPTPVVKAPAIRPGDIDLDIKKAKQQSWLSTGTVVATGVIGVGAWTGYTYVLPQVKKYFEKSEEFKELHLRGVIEKSTENTAHEIVDSKDQKDTKLADNKVENVVNALEGAENTVKTDTINAAI